MDTQINLTTWNSNGLKGKLPSLIHYIHTYNIHILLIQETRLKPTDALKIRDFRTYRLDTDNGQGGLAVLVANNIPHKLKPPPRTSLETITIELADKTAITATYNSPANRFTQRDLDNIFRQGRKVLLVGDLNARHRDWNNHINNRNGLTLAHYADLNNLQIMHPDTPTHYPLNNTTPTTIDLIINKNVTINTPPQSIPDLTSDHNPVLFHLKHTKLEERTLRIRTYKNTNWTHFRQTLDEHTTINNNFLTTLDIDNEVDKITKTIQLAMNKHTALKTISPNKDDLPDDIKRLIQERNGQRRHYQQTRDRATKDLYNDLATQIRQKIRQHRNEKWTNRLQRLKPNDNSLWKLTKALKSTHSQIPTLHHDNKDHHTDAQKADALASTYEQIHTLDTDNPTNEQSTIQRTAHDIIKTPHNITPDELQKIMTTPDELKELLRKLPPNKAPGPDDIPNKIIKNLSRKTTVQLNYIINAMLKQSYFPTNWKHARIVPIQKSGKDPTQTTSYRPISLLPTLSKVAERIILSRLNKIIAKRKLINNTQFGFRPHHTTTHQIARIHAHITDQFNKNKSTALCLLDFEKAFDRVWTDGLIHKLHTQHFPLHLIKLIHSYLQNRTFKVKVQNSFSTVKSVKAGVPQGSVLAPTLFILYTNDIPHFPQHTNIALYADDTAIYSSSFHAQVAIKQIQTHMTLLLPYLEKWYLKLNADKTEVCIFTKKFTNINTPSPLKIKNNNIKHKTPIKYLGVHLDYRLTFNPHIKETIRKAHFTLKQLYPLLKSPHMTIKNKKLLYTTMIRPILTYASPAWHSASKTAKKPLQTLQNKILRLILNADRYTSSRKLHEDAQLPTMNEHLENLANKFYETKNSNPLINESTKIRSHNAPYRIKHKFAHQNLPIFQQPL